MAVGKRPLEDMGVTSSLRGAFRGRRVFLTGHTGFKGGWLALWLHHLGADVHGFSLPPVGPTVYEALGLADMFPGTLADLTDPTAVLDAVQKSQPEIVFHLAAQPLVRRSYREPVETFATNVMGTIRVLEAVRRVPSVRAVVVVTSDKCYENREWLWPYRENEPLGGADPYSASKGCAEIVTASYRRSFFSQPGSAGISTCRAGNVFGGGDWGENRLVPDIARALLAGQPVVLRNPASVRPWQHVLEPLRGYMLVAARLMAGDPTAGDAWNFGPGAGSEVAVFQLASRMVQQWGAGEIVQDPESSAPHEANLLRLDYSKAAALLGWHPVLSLEQGIDWSVEWYRQAHGGRTLLRDIALRQIGDYMSRCGW